MINPWITFRAKNTFLSTVDKFILFYTRIASAVFTNKLLLAFLEMSKILIRIQSRTSEVDHFMTFRLFQAIIGVNGMLITFNALFFTHWNQLSTVEV